MEKQILKRLRLHQGNKRFRGNKNNFNKSWDKKKKLISIKVIS